jgi:hypothetical protein
MVNIDDKKKHTFIRLIVREKLAKLEAVFTKYKKNEMFNIIYEQFKKDCLNDCEDRTMRKYLKQFGKDAPNINGVDLINSILFSHLSKTHIEI